MIAHEIAHVAARHGIEQASKGQLVNYLSIPLIFLGGMGGYSPSRCRRWPFRWAS